MDEHMGACLFLHLFNGFIGNLPGAGRGLGWVLPAVRGGSELAGAFQCDTEFSVEQQREKLHILLLLWAWICVTDGEFWVAGARVTGPGSFGWLGFGAETQLPSAVGGRWLKAL